MVTVVCYYTVPYLRAIFAAIYQQLDGEKGGHDLHQQHMSNLEQHDNMTLVHMAWVCFAI